MTERVYPLRVVFYGSSDEDEVAVVEGYEVHGPFKRPGELWLWANRECYLNVYRGWRADLNALIQENAARGWKAIKMALDDWAIHDLEEYDYPGTSRAHILQGEATWYEWRFDWEKQECIASAPPDHLRAVGPIASCGCEDWPCCVHADDYIYVSY